MDTLPDLFDPIDTHRLRLRCPRPEDAATISAMITPAVSRWLASWQVPFTIELAAKRITAAQKAAFSGRAIPLVIERRQDGAPLGWIDVVRNQPAGRSATLGYWLGEAHHGYGYMREAAPTAVAAAFSLLGLEAVEAAAQPENAASFAVLRSCGMVPAGECMVFASARGREELCLRYEIKRAS
ncbi:GNAT family N-acetyltransferase [Acidocella sp.]|uniref:GNAT family N-acetyltransferase n=1 Tax=Acidocella sp. TaxID=50710 RepID=UPI00260AD2AF|nr:GNAT family N-acetyltransferase [Acidocella sp.]